MEDGKQLIKASGSVSENYREVKESPKFKPFWVTEYCNLRFICNLVLGTGKSGTDIEFR